MFDEYVSKDTKKSIKHETRSNSHQVKRNTCQFDYGEHKDLCQLKKKNRLKEDYTAVPIQKYAKNNIVQCTRRKEYNGKWTTCSSFNHDIILQNDKGDGEGGAITVFLNGSGLFKHRIVALEWHDGTQGDKKEAESYYVIHLDTPELHTPEEGENHVMRNQLLSALPLTTPMMCGAKKLEWDLEYSASKVHDTRFINEEQKNNRIAEFDREINKGYTYEYSILGNFYKNSHNCKSWARQVAPEVNV